MPTVHFQLATDLAPEAVLSALTDFSDRRPDLYRNIDRSHFRVHGRGPGWADVTEGNVLAWERSRYEWDAASGLVTVKTTESDSWSAGDIPGPRPHDVEQASGDGLDAQIHVIRAGQQVGQPGDRREPDRDEEDTQRRPWPGIDTAPGDQEDAGCEHAAMRDVEPEVGRVGKMLGKVRRGHRLQDRAQAPEVGELDQDWPWPPERRRGDQFGRVRQLER